MCCRIHCRIQAVARTSRPAPSGTPEPGKGLPFCVPPIALRKLWARFEDGSKKYALHNWMKGIPLSRFQDAINRHALAWAEGDTSEDHLGAILWNAACAAWTEAEIAAGRLPAELNDLPFRPKTP